MRRGLTTIIMVCVSIGALFTSSGQAAEELVIAVDQGNPPFMFQEDGEAVGIYPTLLSAIFDRMGVEVAIKPYPWRRALIMGEDGDVGVGGIYQTAERLKIFDYSAPLYTERILLYSMKEDTFTFNTLSDLEGKLSGPYLAGVTEMTLISSPKRGT